MGILGWIILGLVTWAIVGLIGGIAVGKCFRLADKSVEEPHGTVRR